MLLTVHILSAPPGYRLDVRFAALLVLRTLMPTCCRYLSLPDALPASGLLQAAGRSTAMRKPAGSCWLVGPALQVAGVHADQQPLQLQLQVGDVASVGPDPCVVPPLGLSSSLKH